MSRDLNRGARMPKPESCQCPSPIHDDGTCVRCGRNTPEPEVAITPSLCPAHGVQDCVPCFNDPA